MTAPSPNDPLGYDALIDENDLARDGRSATGLEDLEAAILHRLTCEKLAMIEAPNGEIDFGVNVHTWIGEVVDDQTAAAKIPIIDEVLHRDPRVRSNVIAVRLAPPGTLLADKSQTELLIDITTTTTTGAVIDRIVGISNVSVAFLAQGT